MTPNRVVWLGPDDPADAFPDVSHALREPDGLLAAGGDLDPERLLAAYVRGIFPWYDHGQPILWWSPDPRCVLFPAELHISRRLRQHIRKSSATLTFNHRFDAVVKACAGRRRSQQGTWITPEMIDAYTQLHRDGWAHSIEVVDNGELVGGLYGLCIGRVFFGESMFSGDANASKLAMLGLTRHMLEHGLELLDCQMVSRHLLSMGATTLPRAQFTRRLKSACEPPNRYLDWPQQPLEIATMLRA